MDLSYSPQYRQFEEEVRAFLQEKWVPRKKATDSKDRKALEQAFRKDAIAAGYLYRSIPKIYGGSEQPSDIVKAQIIGDEFAAVGAPQEVAGVGTKMLVPTLLEHGEEWQKQQFVAKTIAGEYLWAQGYSEPNSGSDLASVRTRGRLENGEWIINGQKIWSTLAHRCHYMFALVRTEPDAGKHDGLSYLLLDLRQPGVEIRPLKQMTGRSEFCEVFFTDARTPQHWIVGGRGQGWKVTRSTLAHERSYIGGAERFQQTYDRLLDLARNRRIGDAPALSDPQIRQRLAAVAGSLAALTYSGYRQMSMAIRKENPGIAPLLSKLYGTNIGHEMAKIARDLVGDHFMLAPPPEDQWRGAGAEKWNNQFMGTLGVAIAGGTSNIQRNIIAERGLGLVSEDKHKP